MNLISNRTLSLLMLFCSVVFSSPTLAYEVNEATINAFYKTLPKANQQTMADRIDTISARFSGKPYLLGALGEGPQGRYDQSPLYRFDKFDCATFVDTVLALAFADNAQAFQQCILNIRYAEGKADYLTRNHFTSADWNPNNQAKGYLKDITLQIVDQNDKPIAQTAIALIDKPSWYAHKTVKDIKQNGSAAANKINQRLIELKEKGKKLGCIQQTLAYLPLNRLFDANGQADAFLFKQIPNAAILEIVRPNWDLQKQAGTHLHVSHIGFGIWKNGQLLFREASSVAGKIVDVPLEDYLRNALNSPTIKGINVQAVLPQAPLNGNCSVNQGKHK